MTANLSVRFKIFAAIALAVSAIVLFQLAYFPSRQIEQLTQSAERKAVSLSRLVAYEVRSGLEFDDRAAIKEVLLGAAEDPEVAYTAVYAEDGTLFAANDPRDLADNRRSPRAERQTTVELVDDLVTVTTPVQAKGAARGSLVLALSTERIRAERADIRRTTLVIGLVTLGAGFLLAYVTGTLIGRRLASIMALAERVAAGDLSDPRVVDDSHDEIGRLAEMFTQLVRSLSALQERVRDVAGGDLSSTTELPGDLAGAFNRMIVAQRELVGQIGETAVSLNAAAGEFLANAKQQERGATEQSSSVEQTRKTMGTLRASADQITVAADDVLENAERAQANSQIVAERIAALSAHTHRITEILEVIKDIANKSDLLALNAALEGTKAGEAGRGFSLVASQMQRLAESVMRSVGDIKELTGTIIEATQATVLATELSTKLVADTTRSARQIALISQQQQSGAEQASGAMKEVAEVASQTAAGSKEIVASATDLIELSGRLESLVRRFKVNGEKQA